METEKIDLISNEKIYQLQYNIIQCTVNRTENELPRIVSTGLKPSLYSQVPNQGVHSRNALLLLQQEKYRNINEVNKYSKLIHQHNIQKIIDETVSRIQTFSIDKSIDKEVEHVLKSNKEENNGFIDNIKNVRSSTFKITDLDNLKISILKEPLLPSLKSYEKILNRMNDKSNKPDNSMTNNISEQPQRSNVKIENDNSIQNTLNNNAKSYNNYSTSTSIKGDIDDINIMDILNDADILFDKIENSQFSDTSFNNNNNNNMNMNNMNNMNNVNSMNNMNNINMNNMNINTSNKNNKNPNPLKRKINDDAVRCPFENSFKSAKVQLSINQRMKEEGHNPYSNDVNGYSNNSISNRYYSKSKYNNNNNGGNNGNSYGFNANNNISMNSNNINNRNNFYSNNINNNTNNMYNNNYNNNNNNANFNTNNTMNHNFNSNSFSDNYYNKKMTYGVNNNNMNNRKRTLGTSGNRQKFVSPLINKKNETSDEDEICKKYGYYLNSGSAKQSSNNNNNNNNEEVDERLKNIEPKMIEMIMNEMLDKTPTITWDDIAGLDHAKETIMESVIWPMQRPDIFTGLRGPPKGLLLYGPPGTGKTLIGKCIASQSGATFFNISSSSLTSKWIGEGEKMVRALFAVARVHQPSVIFVDEIDSLLTQRTDGENEANRRIKTEFLVQFDGCGTNAQDRILLIGATNRPGEIDEAARRRFRKKLYIPLPDDGARKSLLMNLLKKQPGSHNLSEEEIASIVEKTKGYSGSDVDGLCREAALGPIRELKGNIINININDVRPMNYKDFIEALSQVRASVSEKDLEFYLKFDEEHGSKR